MMKSMLGAASLVLAVSAYFYFHDVTPPTESNPGKIPGSYKALVEWNAQRTYPTGSIPPGGVSRAFTKMKRDIPSAQKALKLKKAAAWQSLGPHEWAGRTLAIEIHPQNPNLMYAGSASGGLWRSETGGAGELAWERVSTGFSAPGVSAIAIPADQPQVIYIGTGEVYQYKEAKMGVNDRITRGSYGIGVLKSEDGGATWKPSLDWRLHQERGVMDIETDPTDGNVVWAATTEGVYKSSDAGVTWTRSLPVVMATSIVINPNQPNRILAACGGFSSEGHGVYLSKNGGDSWDKVTEGLPETFNGKAILDIAPSNPNIVYASIANGWSLFFGNATWLCRSEDGGETFTIVNEEDYAAWQGWYSHYVAVHPEDPDQVFLGGIILSYSSDGGKTIVPVSNAFTDHHAQAFAPGQPDKFYIAADQGLGVFNTETGNIDNAHHGMQTMQFYNGMANSQTQRNLIFGGPQDYGASFKYDDTGWNYIEGGREGAYSLIDPNNEEVTYHAGSDHIFMSRLGLPGEPAFVPPCEDINSCISDEMFKITAFNAPLVLSPSNPNVLYAARNAVYRSDDQATSWQAPNEGVPLDGNPILTLAVSHTDENKLYAGTAPAGTADTQARMGIFRTLDGGVTWNNVTGILPDRHPTDLIVDPSDDNIIYVTLSGFGSSHLYRSKDGGQTWENLDRGNLPDVPTHAFALDPETGHLYVGNDLGVFVSVDDGGSWFSFNEGLPEVVIAIDLMYYPPERLLRVGTYGNGLYESPMLPRDTELPVQSTDHAHLLPEIRTDGDWNTRIAVVNPTSDEASFEINGFNQSGALVANLPQTLGSSSRLYQTVTELFGESGTDVKWVSINGGPDLQVFAEVQGPNVRSAYPAAQSDYEAFMPHVARDTVQFKTVLSAVNPTGGSAEARLIEYPKKSSSQLTNLTAYTQTSGQLQSWLGQDLSGVQWAQLRSDRTPIAAMEYFTRLPQEREMASLALESSVSNRLRFLHIAKNTDLFWTGVVYINVGDRRTVVQETYFSEDGGVLGAVSVPVQPGSKETLLFDYLTVEDPASRFFPNTSWVEVTADQPLVGYELFGAPTINQNDTFAGLQGNDESGTRLIYPHVQSTDTLWTGVVAVNTSNVVDDLNLTLYNRQGQVLATATRLAVNPKAKITLLVRDLFPDHHQQGAWIEAESRLGHNWSGFLLWGDQGESVRHHMSGIRAGVR